MICRHFGTCGGCQTQDLSYPAQLAHKHAFVISLFAPSVAAEVIEPVRGMPVDEDGQPWRFRHKAAFVFGGGGGRALLMGHYAQGTQTIVPLSECPVHADRANRVAFALRDRLAAARISAAGANLSGILRHLIVRTTHDERDAVAMLVVTRNDRVLRRPVQAFLASPDAPTAFFVNVNDRPGPFMVGRETIRLAGPSHIRERHLGPTLLLSPDAFFQTNPEGARMLVEEVLHATAPETSGTVLDLYSGSGLFALPLAQRGWRVTAVEENRQAMRDAAANARLNEVPAGRLRFVPARVEAALQTMSATWDRVVLDPPRQGCTPAVIDDVFGRLEPRRAIYVSCNPASLAAELPAIVRHGYRVSRVLPVDMFPHTEHVELVATLDRVRSRAGLKP